MTDNPFGRPLPMVALLIPFLALMFVRPFADPIQATVEVLGLLLLLGITSVHTVKSLRDADEVQLAGARFIMSVGALLGLLGAVFMLLAVLHVPGAADWIASAAARPPGNLPAAASGFVLGVLMLVVLALTSSMVAHVVWVRRMTRP